MIARNNEIERRGFGYFELGPNDIVMGPLDSKYSVMALCISGECDFEVNMAKVHLETGSRLILSHVLYPKGLQATPDFKVRLVIVTSPFAVDLLVGIPTESLSMLAETPVASVTNQAEWQILTKLMDVISIYANQDGTSRAREIVGSCYRMMIQVMAEFEQDAPRTSHHKASYTMADVYFKKFIDLLQDNIKTEHEVAFYAMKLNITPKYLSEITKQKTSHKAKEVISHLLAIMLKREMLYSGKSMKVIAYDYCFADQSSLGKFFRKMTGMSPSEFKKQQGNGAL